MVQSTALTRPVRAILDTRNLAPAERFDAWADAVSGSFVPLRAATSDAESRGHFGGSLVSQPLGNAFVSSVAGEAVRVSRTPMEIAHADPGYVKLGLQLRGFSVISQDGRDAALAPGDFALYDTTRPYELDFDASFRMFVVMVPAESLRLDHDRTRTVTASRISGRRGLGAITSQFLRAVSDQLDHDALSGRVELSDAVFDLLTATLAEQMDAELGDDRSQRRALTAQVEAYIAAHLADPTLTVAHIADVHHVSVRYLQKLFEEREETVSGLIRRRRLEQSRRDLASVPRAADPIARVAARYGFADGATYARAFRGEYGVTPSEYRASSQRR